MLPSTVGPPSVLVMNGAMLQARAWRGPSFSAAPHPDGLPESSVCPHGTGTSDHPDLAGLPSACAAGNRCLLPTHSPGSANPTIHRFTAAAVKHSFHLCQPGHPTISRSPPPSPTNLFTRYHQQCDGEFSVSTWLGHGTELFGHIPVEVKAFFR